MEVSINIDADKYFKSGADSVLGTGSINNPNIAKTISQKYGNQSIIQSIDCRKTNGSNFKYDTFSNSGKTSMKQDPLSLSKKQFKMA